MAEVALTEVYLPIYGGRVSTLGKMDDLDTVGELGLFLTTIL